jgi:hypothetical protein
MDHDGARPFEIFEEGAPMVLLLRAQHIQRACKYMAQFYLNINPSLSRKLKSFPNCQLPDACLAV